VVASPRRARTPRSHTADLPLPREVDDVPAFVAFEYPSTEFLHLPFLDFVCFNVFLEQEQALARYLARLHTLAGDRPLVLGEIGLDSRRNGPDAQAASLAAQLRVSYAAGCAGCCVFAWTDEWHRGGLDVDDWDFGVVDRERAPKPALGALRDAFAHVPFAPRADWPRASVVVCTYNGAQTIDACVEALLALDYPDCELLVVDDGSTDGAGERAAALGVRVIRTENRGLSAARNAGTAAATGEIVAFCDDDCVPDPHWLRHLVASLQDSGDAGVGGPNVPPADALVAEGVGHAPGGPMHVLVSDVEAEHIPGCNMAFRRAALEQVGGFDPCFRVAGDDVDLCWRIQDAGGRLGFSPAALVWHRARRSVPAYVRQQIGYGRAEALLERKWPERYNHHGHVSWSGSVHGGKVRRCFSRRRWRVYHGASGAGLFQSVYGRRDDGASAFPLIPEWHLLLLVLAAASACALLGAAPAVGVPPVGLPLALVLFLLCLLAIVGQAAAWTMAVVLPPSLSRRRDLHVRAIVFVLCMLQPVARLWGRLQHGLTPWRRHGPRVVALPRRRQASVWSEVWEPVEGWVERLHAALRGGPGQVVHGGAFDTWDPLRLVDEVLDGGAHAVARPALVGGVHHHLVAPARRQLRSASDDARLLIGVAVVLGHAHRRVVHVASPVRPLEVVRERQRPVRAHAVEDAQLLVHRVPVVIPVEEHDVRRRVDRGQGVVAQSLVQRGQARPLRSVVARVERRDRIDHVQVRSARAGVRQQLRRVPPPLRPDLDHRVEPLHRVEQRANRRLKKTVH
jgi:GT2 family glycosyltransferase